MDKATKRKKLLELEQRVQAGATESELHQLRVELGINIPDADEGPLTTEKQSQWNYDIEIYYRLRTLGLNEKQIAFAFNLQPQVLNKMRNSHRITKSHITRRLQHYDQQLQCSKTTRKSV